MLIKSLEDNPQQGTPLGNNCFKIRISIASKDKGKPGGSRIISHILIREESVFLLTMYDKSEKENITNNELAALLRQLDD